MLGEHSVINKMWRPQAGTQYIHTSFTPYKFMTLSYWKKAAMTSPDF